MANTEAEVECSITSKRSILCLHEKLYTATYPDQEELLNK